MTKKIIFGFLALLPFFSEAQSFYAIRRPRNMALSIGTGTATYSGELVNPKQVGKVRYNLSFGAEYSASSRIKARAELIWFNISGSDENANDSRVERNLSFTSNNQELSLSGAVYLFKEPKEFHRRLSFNAFGFIGVGVLHMNPKTEYEGKKYALQPLQTEGVKYSQYQVVIPYGLGVRISAGPLYNVIIEGGYRKTFTDYLDDISSKNYADPSTLIGGVDGISAKLSDRRKERDPNYPLDYTGGTRGNPQKNDSYFLFNIKLQYYIPQFIGGGNNGNSFYRKKRKSVFNPNR